MSADKPSVLVVDDDSAIRSLVQATLGRAGYCVEQAANGRAGVDRVLAHPNRFSLVLMDYRMPELDGLAATNVIRKQAPGVPVALMSTENVDVDLVATGISAFLPKPFEADALVQFVKNNSDS